MLSSIFNPLLHFVKAAVHLISSENLRFSELTCIAENEVKGLSMIYIVFNVLKEWEIL